MAEISKKGRNLNVRLLFKCSGRTLEKLMKNTHRLLADYFGRVDHTSQYLVVSRAFRGVGGMPEPRHPLCLEDRDAVSPEILSN